MASITILEKDLTTAASETSDNIIYVPGYAVRGPLNEPTLCTSLDSFQEIFGSTPYKFKDDQYINGEIFIAAENYERGYIYAAELLKAGAQVLFERIGDEDKVGYGELTIPLYAGRYEKPFSISGIKYIITNVAKTDGKYITITNADFSTLGISNDKTITASVGGATITSSDSYYTNVSDMSEIFTQVSSFTEVSISEFAEGVTYYTLDDDVYTAVTDEYDSSKTYYTYSLEDADNYYSFDGSVYSLASETEAGTTYYTLTETLYVADTSDGYVEVSSYDEVKVSGENYFISKSSVSISGSTITIYIADSEITWTNDEAEVIITTSFSSSEKLILIGEYSKQGTLTWRIEYNGTKLADDTIVYDSDEEIITFNNLLVYSDGSKSYIDLNSDLNTDHIVNTEVKAADLVIKSKYAGSYAANISVKVTATTYSSGEPYFKLTESYDGESNSVTISLNEDSNYYYETMNNSLSFVEIESIKLDSYDTLFLKTVLPIVETASSSLDYISTSNGDDEFSLEDFYKLLSGYEVDEDTSEASIFEELIDKGTYDVKYITSGGYPVYLVTSVGNGTNSVTADINGLSIANEMLLVAAERADAIALIDHYDIAPKKLYNYVNSAESGFNNSATNSLGENTRKYGAMFTPWCKFSMNTLSSNLSFPASFAYLKCMASSVQSNPNWYAVSGVTRGAVPNILSLNQKMTGAIADLLQTRTGVSINPITTISPYGLCIWGARTLMSNPDDLTASSFLNIRVLSCDLKKSIYKNARKLTWELNNDILWMNFKSAIEETLDAMVSGNGLSGYKITKVATDKKATIKATIRVYAVEPVEDWDFTIELADSYVSVE